MTLNDEVIVVQTYAGGGGLSAGAVPLDSTRMKEDSKVSGRV